MKYYGERTQKLYDTEKACMEAEAKAKEQENLEKIKKERELALQKEQALKAAAERKAMADKVEEARKAMIDAQKAYKEALDAFLAKYNTYHFSTSNPEEILPVSISDLLDKIFRW